MYTLLLISLNLFIFYVAVNETWIALILEDYTRLAVGIFFLLLALFNTRLIVKRRRSSRNCYCYSMSDESRQEQDIPEGYCGTCEECGAPGHTQHFPGPVPYTGAWCDSCVKKVALHYWLNILDWKKISIILITVAILTGSIYYILKQL